MFSQWINQTTHMIMYYQSVNFFKKLVRGTNITNPYHHLCTTKQGVWLSRLRMGLSALNSHRHNYNFINSPICNLCDGESETTFHFLITCPAHHHARQVLFNHLQTSFGIDTNDQNKTILVILEGHHISPRHYAELLSCVSVFLTDTDRFR